MRDQTVHMVRVFKPDPERQKAALVLLLQAPRGDEVGPLDGAAPSSEPETPWWCFRQGESWIIWSAAGPPVGDDEGPFEFVEAFPFDANPTAELVDDPNAYLWPPDLNCEACGRPLIFEGVPCLCEIADHAA